MIRTVMFVPIRDNSDQPFTRADWRALRARLRELGGYTPIRSVYGEWFDEDGELHRDRSHRFIVTLTVQQLPQWVDLVRWARERFRQKAIYVEVSGTAIVGSG